MNHTVKTVCTSRVPCRAVCVSDSLSNQESNRIVIKGGCNFEKMAQHAKTRKTRSARYFYSKT